MIAKDKYWTVPRHWLPGYHRFTTGNNHGMVIHNSSWLVSSRHPGHTETIKFKDTSYNISCGFWSRFLCSFHHINIYGTAQPLPHSQGQIQGQIWCIPSLIMGIEDMHYIYWLQIHWRHSKLHMWNKYGLFILIPLLHRLVQWDLHTCDHQ